MGKKKGNKASRSKKFSAMHHSTRKAQLKKEAKAGKGKMSDAAAASGASASAAEMPPTGADVPGMPPSERQERYPGGSNRGQSDYQQYTHDQTGVAAAQYQDHQQTGAGFRHNQKWTAPQRRGGPNAFIPGAPHPAGAPNPRNAFSNPPRGPRQYAYGFGYNNDHNHHHNNNHNAYAYEDGHGSGDGYQPGYNQDYGPGGYNGRYNETAYNEWYPDSAGHASAYGPNRTAAYSDEYHQDWSNQQPEGWHDPQYHQYQQQQYYPPHHNQHSVWNGPNASWRDPPQGPYKAGRYSHQPPSSSSPYHSDREQSRPHQSYGGSSPSGGMVHRTHQPPAIRAKPRSTYLQQASQEPCQLSEEEAAQRKLLVVLDLNGTLVFRAKGGGSRAIDSTRPVPRPYLSCFLQYCLGIDAGNATEENKVAAGSGSDSMDETASGRHVPVLRRPHGSQFWRKPEANEDAVEEPSSHGRAEVVIWSSAQPRNVDSMVVASFNDDLRAKMLRVWARDTLVVSRLFHHKAESVKDLEIIWAELNAWANGKASPGRLKADLRDIRDQLRPDKDEAEETGQDASEQESQSSNAEKELQSKEEKPSAALEAALEAARLGPWGPENTLLVDDSPLKARLQPYNHLLIPEFGKADAVKMRTFVAQQLAKDEPVTETTVTSADATVAKVETEDELEYDSDLSIPEAGKLKAVEASSPPATDTEGGDAAEAEPGKEKTLDKKKQKKSSKKPVTEARLDDVLLQTIGVLEALRYQSNVSSFIHAGGIEGYGQPRSATNDKEREAQIAKGKTPEYWAQQGREACQKVGIEVKAWIPGPISDFSLPTAPAHAQVTTLPRSRSSSVQPMEKASTNDTQQSS